jgi:hypothetical protein
MAEEAPRTPAPASMPHEVEARLAALEQTLASAAAAAAAENLVNAFGYYADEHLWESAAQLFAADAWAEVGDAGIYVGREELRAALQAAYGGRRAGMFQLHQTAQPVIHSSESGAIVRTRLAQIVAVEEGDDAYSAGIYEVSVGKENGAWLIDALDFEPTWAASHSGGWARVARSLSTSAPASAIPAADRPPLTPAASPFPAIVDVPFHYSNPVSGRPPARRSLSR